MQFTVYAVYGSYHASMLGVSCFCLHDLLYHIAALFLYSFSLMFLYLYVCFACWALINLTLYGLCIMIYLCNKNQPDALSFLIYFNNYPLHVLNR